MILGAFGDSFLFGSDLSDCSTEYRPGTGYPHSYKTWPALIAKQLKIEYKCYALPGIGNARIAQTILEAVYNYGNNCFYIINWSWADRYDFYNLNGDIPGCTDWDTVLPGKSNYYSKQYYKFFHSELNDKIISLGSVYQTLTALRAYNCKYIMTFMDDLMLDNKYHCPDNVKFLQNEIRPFLTNFDGLNFLDWSKQHNYEISKKWHPMDHAHKKAAEYWLPKVCTSLNSNAKEEKPNASK